MNRAALAEQTCYRLAQLPALLLFRPVLQVTNAIDDTERSFDTIILAAALSAFTMLWLDPLAALLSGFIVFAWQIILGLLIFGVSLWVAGWVAMALTQMGLADPIITLAFGVPLLGVALAIGLEWTDPENMLMKRLRRWIPCMDVRFCFHRIE